MYIVVDALEEEKPIDVTTWKPVMAKSSKRIVPSSPSAGGTSTTASATTVQVPSDEDKILCQSEIDEWIRKKNLYQSDINKACATFWDHCNEAMQSKIVQRTECDTKIKNNPFELLKAIKEHSMSHQENKHPLMTIIDAVRNVVNMKQGENESILDFHSRFKVARDVLQDQLGGYLSLPAYEKEKIKKCDEDHVTSFDETQGLQDWKELWHEINEELLGYLFFAGVDGTKCGMLQHNMAEQHALGSDKCPTTLVKALNILSQH